MLLLCSPLRAKLSFSETTLFTCQARGVFSTQKMFRVQCQVGSYLQAHREENRNVLCSEENLRRRNLLLVLVTSSIPLAFPSYGKTKGFTVKVVASENYVKRDSGLVVWDIAVGKGDSPKAGQQVTFHYVGYNESGRRIDSSYVQGTPAKIRMGTNALVPGFEEGIRDMKPGGKRRIVIPPELGPPVGPSTFFSSKQFEVFDVELVSIQDCTRRTIGFYSDFVCN
ncbi:peptidyl-prolyl cis-trans isomerase FKBP20-2, chloroplastic isoform X4 [Coffea eugenioides]|uniref:peptidyl-prolyl cis-trans isomerase FKBP20-2, chloroplastic isoform X4 n=1 Tax=Coffea eugenioides TaxID=49369 RepID=UPI000F6064E2|nr:peptidyl-prolyl cis-trans isomerase FKBP20-2, chloroplastic isoform X4 [Coffea eugenioides]